MNSFGITEKSFELLQKIFVRYPQIEEVIIFGSRAKGNYKKGSDIDLAIKGEQCSSGLALKLQSQISEELPIPYMVDVVDYNTLQHHELREHIDRVGLNFYKRDGLDF
jgi:predicted nucleotidyltransferase